MSKKHVVAAGALVVVAAGAVATAGFGLGGPFSPTNVANANKKGPGATQYGAPLSPSAPNGPAVPVAPAPKPGFSSPNSLSQGLSEIVVAQGSNAVENPRDGISAYGYDDGFPFVPVAGGAPGAITLPGAGQIEATKTEPDKNTYLVLNSLKGADPKYDYGHRFLFQGHELGSPGFITRINLDADGAHRVTLLATREVGPSGPDTGTQLPDFDGSTWDPFNSRLLFSSEAGPDASGASQGGLWQGTLDVPSSVVNLQPYLGRGGMEGIQNDSLGNVYVVEDVGGSNIVVNGVKTTAKRPNSFVYRIIPNDPSDLTKGAKIQALQVRLPNGVPITFEDGATVDSPAYIALHQYGSTFKTQWITIATTTSTTAAPGPDDNALAKAAKATPFKRPENGQFRPGTNFREFYFDETGDTNATSPANGVSGGWGSIMKLTQSPMSDAGTISVLYNGDQVHTALDNCAFFSNSQIAFVEDAGDTLHTQRNALDSAYLFDVTKDYSVSTNTPVRFIAEGRDASATLDSSLSDVYSAAGKSFNNEGDNEITGIHVSDGDPSKNGLLGIKTPQPFSNNWFDQSSWDVFWTQQHGDNQTYQIISNG